MKKLAILFVFAFSASCAGTMDRANVGIDSAKKELGTAEGDAKKNADYAEKDVKKETEEEKKE